MKTLRIAICLAATATLAPASLVTFTNQAAFAAAAGPLSTIEFGGAYNGTTTLPLFTALGVTFLGERNPGPGVILVKPSFYQEYYRDGNFAALDSFRNVAGEPSDLTISLPSGVRAVGFALFSTTLGLSGGKDTEHIAVEGSSFTVVTKPVNGLGNGSDLVFFGFVSSSPVASFTITGSNQEGSANIDIEHFTFGPGLTTTPEPATFWPGALLVVAGLACLRRARHRNARISS